MGTETHNPAERTSGARSVLSLALAYRFAQWLIGAQNSRATLVADVLRPLDDERLLDIGCGTADILEHLPSVDYVGFDPNERYVANAESRFGQRARFVTAQAAVFQTSPGGFTLAMAIGVLHHMDDETADQAIALAAQALTLEGRFVTIDPTVVEGQHAVSRFLVSRDRGQHVRSPEQTERLFLGHFKSVAVQVRHDLLRPPYSHVIVTATGPMAGESSGLAS